ncbi:hypothetical protein BDV41DRAFT_267389 [Aspergillus transmontanensis]|uniref:Uncharacterized protein n=1 Tax=Aspergillus transmontanensis TaxID=1034304 RepID=A0A5N6VX76_9EURO|nr:hypothetical protein BDV41DRAFT_267389 [Aspergillus transmontanensis]
MRLELGEVTLYDSAVEYGPMHYSTKCSISLISIDLILVCLFMPFFPVDHVSIASISFPFR